MKLHTLFPALDERRIVIGVVHLPALPGAPGYCGSMSRVIEFAKADARALAEGGVDGIIVENFGDKPFFGETVPPETIASMAVALREIIGEAGDCPVGANVLRNDAAAALALCAATGAGFLRVNVHVGAAVTDQGLIQGAAAETLRRRQVLCPDAALLADVHVKHATPLGSESLEQAAIDTWKRGMVDGLVVSGLGTGQAPDAERVQRIRAVLPEASLLLGSGTDSNNAKSLLAQANGAIVASSLKIDGVLEAPVDREKVKRFVELVQAMGPIGV
ncbi:MAG: membrane complex biogenesis BtpA family protein [Glaciecola sp.]|jgi:membrane complex biogenesis BtpA family protein